MCERERERERDRERVREKCNGNFTEKVQHKLQVRDLRDQPSCHLVSQKSSDKIKKPDPGFQDKFFRLVSIYFSEEEPQLKQTWISAVLKDIVIRLKLKLAIF